MLYLHDAWANWFEEENFNLVPDFHEWNKDDELELMDQTPIIKVNKEMFNYIAYGKNTLKEIAENIEGKSYARINHERVKVEHCFVATDGERTVMVRLNSNKQVEAKSHLIPRTYQLAIELMKIRKYNYELLESYDISHYDNFAGMTRNEKESVKKVRGFLNELNESHVNLLKYILSEIDHLTYSVSRDNGLNELKFKVEKAIGKCSQSEMNRIFKIINKLKLTK
jgi:hypothetical protein